MISAMKTYYPPRPLAILALCICIAMSPSASKPQAIEESVLNSTVLIQRKVDDTHFSQGTGFLVFREMTKNAQTGMSTYQIVLVTNKHVLPAEHSVYSQITAKVATRNNDAIETKDLQIPILGGDGKFLNSVAMNPDPKVDVAAVIITKEIRKENTQYLARALETRHALTTDMLLPTKRFKDAAIGIGTQVYLLGYPNGFSDVRNVSPILRIGIISTEPDKSYSFGEAYSSAANLPVPIPGFLIDANVYPGSSGSMVVRRTDIVPNMTAGGEFSVQYVLGIVADSIPMHDSGINVDERMGLGVVFSSDTILETINLLFRNP